jgi:FkbM family methyltransferase
MDLKGRLIWKLRHALNRGGLDVVPYNSARHPLARRSSLFAHYGIDLVIDVGANGGQYGRFLRNIGYRGRILSLEPLSTAFGRLREAASGDDLWEVRRTAVGDRIGVATLNVAANSESSSFLPMLPEHLAAYPNSRYQATEEVLMTTLKEVIAPLARDDRIFVKVDTQGYERTVIEGAGAALDRVRGVQLEMSIVPLYTGETLLPELVKFMDAKGLTLMSVEPGAGNGTTGQLLQIDGLFFRRESS